MENLNNRKTLKLAENMEDNMSEDSPPPSINLDNVVKNSPPLVDNRTPVVKSLLESEKTFVKNLNLILLVKKKNHHLFFQKLTKTL